MKKPMSKIMKIFIRMSAFLRKEIFEIFRQPRLLITLILGPFLILLIFGIGYRNKAQALRTFFVVQEGSPLKDKIEQYATTLGPQLIYMGVTTDESAALQQLRNGQVDVVAVTPPDASQTIQNSKQAVFTLYHHEIDPFQVDYVKYFGQVYIDEVNRRVLLSITQQEQQNASSLESDLGKARQDAAAMRQAIQQGNDIAARQNQRDLVHSLDNVNLAVGASLALLSGVEQNLGSGSGQATAALKALADLRNEVNTMQNLNSVNQVGSQQEQQLADVQDKITKLEDQLKQFTSIDPNVIVRPFRSETESIATIQPSAVDYFVPAVIALLIQHLTVTLAALSIVRERTIGTMELFRVSPLSAGEALFGKYLSYLIFGILLVAVLTALLILGLKMPMLGSYLDYALVIVILLFTSLGFGFFISMVSQTDTQAVQYTMIMLLASVFFSGFMMNLDMIWKPVRVLSWSLPTTYGIITLRNIMLRGDHTDLMLIGGLFLIGIGFLIVNWLLLRRLTSPRVD